MNPFVPRVWPGSEDRKAAKSRKSRDAWESGEWKLPSRQTPASRINRIAQRQTPAMFGGARSARDNWEYLDIEEEEEEDFAMSNTDDDRAAMVRDRSAREAMIRRAAKRKQGDRPSDIEPGDEPIRKNRERGYADWLADSKNWLIPVGEDWVPIKVLGEGGYGVCGLWEYKGRKKRNITKVAIKQSGDLESLETEARFMRTVAASGSRHALKIYRDIMYDYADIADLYRGFIGRIYLEFMEGGDLMGYMQKTYEA